MAADVVFGVCESSETDKTKEYLPDCRSVLVCGLSYNKLPPAFPLDAPRRVFSVMACGEDYHITLARILEQESARIAAALGDKSKDFKYYIHVDKGRINERELAIRAKLGFRGRHNLIINERLGSMFNIGLLLTNIAPDVLSAAADLPPQNPPPAAAPCEDCGKCAAACPTSALTASGGFNKTRCISALTQKKGTDPPVNLRGYLYGCDICQFACPYNKDKAQGVVSPDEIYPLLTVLLSMNEADFKRGYNHRACYWRGLEILKRNARAAEQI